MDIEDENKEKNKDDENQPNDNHSQKDENMKEKDTDVSARIFDNFLDKYKNVDKNDIEGTFKNLFENETKYQEHLERRKKFGHITKNNSEKDYFNKTIDCIKNSDIIILEEYKDFWEKLYFSEKDSWLVIINDKGNLVTSYKIDELEKQKKLQLKKDISGIRQKEVSISEDIRRKIESL